MKVVCDACQAKYQIPDERVTGRRLKIRCRKCGTTILVRGDQDNGRPTLEPPPEAVAEWHVSLQGDQHGPYPTDQMSQMLRGGQLSWDAYVWRESYGDWKMAGDSDTLVKAVARASSPADPSPNEQTPIAAVVATAAALPSSPGFDPGEETPTRMMQSSPALNNALKPAMRKSFAARAQVAQSQPQMVAVGDVARPQDSSPRMVAVGGGANGRASQPPQGAAISGSYAPVSTPAPYARARVDMDAALTGERHEDSVLFSAHNLVATPAISSPPSRPGYASAEGSGLIDIRALAALARGNNGARPAAQANGEPVRGRETQDEIYRLANQAGAFGKLDSVAPLDRPTHSPGNAMPLAVFGGFAMVAVAVVFAVYVLRPQPQTQPIAVSAPTAPTTSANGEPTLPRTTDSVRPAAQAETPEPNLARAAAREPATTVRPQPVEPNGIKPGAVAAAKIAKALPVKHGATASSAPAAVGKTKELKADSEPAASDSKSKKESTSASIDDLLLSDKVESKPAAKPEPAPAAAAAPKGKRSIDDLLDDAVVAEKSGKKEAAAQAADSALPETPSRDQVLAAMRGVDSEVKACAEGQTLDSPTAMVAITVAGTSGKVSSARVTGVTGPAGSCIARAVRSASFPKFARENFSINFPFKLKQ